jgi:hypothetical protein
MRLLFIVFSFLMQLFYAQTSNNLNSSSKIYANCKWPLIDYSKDTISYRKSLVQCWIQNDSLLFSISTSKQQKFVNKIHVFSTNLKYASPQIICDTSKTKFNKRIYISWADQKNGKENWDVFVAYSDDDGENWTEPILITYHPNHKSQYEPHININQSNGDLFLCYFDKQNYLNKDGRDIYLAKSTNGGLQFDYVKLNTKPLKSDFLNKNVLLFSKNESKYYWRNIKSLKEVLANEMLQELNPFLPDTLLEQLLVDKTFSYSEKLSINVNCSKKMKVAMAVTKPIDPAFGTKIIGTKRLNKGNNTLLIDLKAHKIVKGNYTLTLYFNGMNKYIWIVED